jgi:phosphatidate phosphatase APP1
MPQGKYKDWTTSRWDNFRDSVFTTHKKRLEEIFEKFGYPRFGLVGEKGAQDYWVMVQHCDSDPAFQSRVLKIEERSGQQE